MNIEELKIVLDMVNGVTDGAITISVMYLLLNSLIPLAKYGLVGYILINIVNKIVNLSKDLNS